LRLSSDEITRLELIVRGHLRPMVGSGCRPANPAVYWYFETWSFWDRYQLALLADTLATYGTSNQETWSKLDVVRLLWRLIGTSLRENFACAIGGWTYVDEQVRPCSGPKLKL
jgi:hypothetical protein